MSLPAASKKPSPGAKRPERIFEESNSGVVAVCVKTTLPTT